MGERCIRTAEVRGSIPLSSTNRTGPCPPLLIACPGRLSSCRIAAVQHGFHRNGHEGLNVFHSSIRRFARQLSGGRNMAYDRYDTRNAPRDERSRWSEDHYSDRDRQRERGGRDDRGFFERAGDEIASWFGDDDAERRRRQDNARQDRESGWGSPERGSQRDWDRERMSRDRDWHRDEGRERGFFGSGRRDEGDWNEPRENRSWRREMWGGGDRDRDRERSFGSDRDRG